MICTTFEIKTNLTILFYTTQLKKKYSYKILAPKAIEENKDLKKATGAVLEIVELDPESYRLGHTKACNVYYS